MPDAILISTAKAVVTALNTAEAVPGTFVKDFSAERSYADWELPLESMEGAAADTVYVDVTPAPAIESRIHSRNPELLHLHAVDIIVRKRLGPENRAISGGKLTLAEVDELVYLVEQLAEFFVSDTLSNGAHWNQSEILRAYVPVHLRENAGQFTGQVRVTFELAHDIA